MRIEAATDIAAAPAAVYNMVSDITRYGEWSPENLGGTWLDGASGPAVGARFKSKNKRRVSWSTTCAVTAAEPDTLFAFSVGKTGDVVWAYAVTPTDAGSHVVESVDVPDHTSWIEKLLTRIATGKGWEDRKVDLKGGMQTTLDRLKTAAEST